VNFNKLRDEVIRELHSPESRRAFREARFRRAAFASYATLVAALAHVFGLGGEYGRADGATIDAFMRAVLDEHVEHPHRVWPTALMAAFFPAIKRLKRKAVSSAHNDDGIRDLVLIGCLEAVDRVAQIRDRDRLPMRLRQAMRRHVFRAIRAACRERELLRDLVTVALDTGAMEPFAQGRREAVPHVGEMLVEIREATRSAHDGDDSQLTKKLAAASTLRERLRMLYPDVSAEDQEQMYQRLKRRSTRALTRVKSAAGRAEREAAKALTTRRPALRRPRKEAVR
jgi:hypothetical protein